MWKKHQKWQPPRATKEPQSGKSQSGSSSFRKPKAGGVLLTGFLLWLFLGSAPGQFRSHVQTVLVRVSVTTATGAPVLDLAEEDFELTSDGEARGLTYFEPPGGPMAVMLVFDASSSMEGQSSRFSVEAARRFASTLAASDEVGLVSFDQRPRLELELGKGADQMQQALDGISSRGGTALYDAIELGYRALETSSLHRQVMLVLSDGLEEDSATSFAELERLVAGRNVVFSSISWIPSEMLEFYEPKGRYYKQPQLEENLNPIWVLNRLAGLTGGESLFPAHREALLLELRKIARRLRSSYLIGFQPGAPGRDEFHEIQVRLPRTPEYRIEHRTRGA